MTERPAFDRLTAVEARRALFIDFEGGKDVPPVWLGVHRRGRGDRPYVHGIGTSAEFELIVGAPGSLRAAVLNVVVRAEAADRRLVAWTEHELKIVRTWLADEPDLVHRFESRYANAKRIAERWRSKVYGGMKPDDGKLASYLSLIRYEVPKEAVAGHVGDTVRAIRDRLARGLEPTAAQLERWRRLVEHNRHDCIGMRKLTLRATREIDDFDRARLRRRHAE